MGESVLTYQFVAGLTGDIKAKVVGCERTFDELLLKARFEEARLRDIIHQGNFKSHQAPSATPSKKHLSQEKTGQKTSKSEQRCYNCNGTGHYARECPYRGRGAPTEAKGRSSNPTNKQHKVVSMLQAQPNQQTKQHATGEDTEGDNKVGAAVSQVMATMHGIQPSSKTPAKLGPTPTGDVLLDGIVVEALLDTGSPISIISLGFFLDVAAKNRLESQTPEDWGKAVRARLQPTSVSLRSYGGEELNIVSQVSCCIRCGEQTAESVLQVQKGAPVKQRTGARQ